MEGNGLIISGLIGSVVTLLLTAIIDYIKERFKSKIEKEKMLFQRKTDVAEKAMTWLQEAIDCYRILQMACKEINGIYNPVTWNKLQMSLLQANQLYRDTSRSLYSIYLYYDFSEIEIKHNCLESNYNMNYAFTELGRLEQQASDLREKGYDDNSQEIKALKKKALSLFEKLAQAADFGPIPPIVSVITTH